MKRSEAIEEIRKILAMNGKDNGYGELEEAILHQLEVIGMLPPVEKEHWLDRVGVEVSKEHLENHGYPITAKRKYYALRGAVVSISTWEPEDEEK
jgi:hypothetical protein